MLEAWPLTPTQSLGDELIWAHAPPEVVPKVSWGTWWKAGKRGKATQGHPHNSQADCTTKHPVGAGAARLLAHSLEASRAAPTAGFGDAHLWARTPGGRPPACSPARSGSGARPPPPGSGARSRRCPPSS